MKHDGLLVEVLTKAQLLKNDLMVSQPIDPASRYDLIVDNGKRLFKVQIKGIRAKLPHRDAYRLRVYTRTKRSKTKDVERPYTKDEVDMYVVYIKPLDIWYVIPQDTLDGKKEVSIYPNSESMYDVYQDAWYLFDNID
jgi:PD-(D/E)XK nuclease superfamily protein